MTLVNISREKRTLVNPLSALLKQGEQPMFIIRQHNAVSTRQGFNEALRLALDLRALGWACCIENQDGEVLAE